MNDKIITSRGTKKILGEKSMSKLKKVLVGAAVILGVLVLDIMVQNVTGFIIPETVMAPMGALVGIAVYKGIEIKMDAKQE